MEKKVILGGAFNPPTIAHFSVAEQIINEIDDVEDIVFMPVNSDYEKLEKPIENEHRYNMLEMICKDNPKFNVSRLELDYDRVLTTIETLRILKEQYPNNEIIFATGTDNLKELETWNNCQDILNEFKLIIFERGEDDFDSIVKSSKFLLNNKCRLIKLENNYKTNLSSTYLREKIRRNKNIKYLTPDCIIEYINKNHLYLNK